MQSLRWFARLLATFAATFALALAVAMVAPKPLQAQGLVDFYGAWVNTDGISGWINTTRPVTSIQITTYSQVTDGYTTFSESWSTTQYNTTYVSFVRGFGPNRGISTPGGSDIDFYVWDSQTGEYGAVSILPVQWGGVPPLNPTPWICKDEISWNQETGEWEVLFRPCGYSGDD